MPTHFTLLTKLTAVSAHGPGRSVTALAGMFPSILILPINHSRFMLAYDGQSGSKDRGDPEVSDLT